MKRVNIIIRLLLAIILLPTIAACDKDNNGSDAMHVDVFDVLVRFESPIGTNILDSLNVQPTEVATYNKLDDLYVNWKNKNDNFSSSSWYEPRLYWRHFPDSAYSHNPNFSYKGMGTILEMGLIDRNVSDSDYPKADEVYSITLKSKKIFGNDSPHTIKYYVHINGGGCGYDAKKCEVDGKDYPIIGPYSNLHLNGVCNSKKYWLSSKSILLCKIINENTFQVNRLIKESTICLLAINKKARIYLLSVNKFTSF